MRKFRAPAVPLFTVDPYFSVWSKYTRLNADVPMHWTGARNYVLGAMRVDGVNAAFLGFDRNMRKFEQISLDIDALSTKAVFEGFGIRASVRMMTPLFLDDVNLLSRPVSYMEVRWEPTDGKAHEVSLSVSAEDTLVLNSKGQKPIVTEEFRVGGVSGLKMGAEEQNVLNRSGDDLRIDWGYLYLGMRGETRTEAGAHMIRVEKNLAAGEPGLVLLAYDDVESIQYFGKNLVSPWRDGGKCIRCAITAANEEYETLVSRADKFSAELYAEAVAAGGKKYADLLNLAYRQILAAAKLVRDEAGDLLYISKECFSNGCAATVDVSYPSIPIFLRYNPELVRAMMRPIYKFAASPAWEFDFAPHDAGQYPLVNGQVYGLDRATGKLRYEMQMPVEECGNMIIMEATAVLADGKTDFPKSHFDTLLGWTEYLIRFGDDPENQLCTDDFAGHLAHNCNLSLKAIMGIMGTSVLCDKLGKKDEAEKFAAIAKEKAQSWVARAANGDGSYRLAFDKPDSFSMKYNMVWDKIWGTGLFPAEVVESEIASYFAKMNRYGLPLDSRADNTKSDWLVWTATMAKTKGDFEKFIAPLWRTYDESFSHVPMTDWYDTVTGGKVGFQHRTVQGGLFIKLLEKSGKLAYRK
ncbi:MAG: DUF4965 domain-containing protein [Clostridia bacterium]|nr:DUF4965 domain-containing protein [Clostridia bacterium]